MAPSAVTGFTGQPMSWERFLELPDELRAEYVDGRAFVNPPPSFAHQMACVSLRDLLVAQLPAGAVVAMAVGWRLPAARPRLRIPDLVVLTDAPAGDLVTETPVVAIEVLSTNRRHDLVRKSAEYLEAGLAHYWVVDLRERAFTCFTLVDGAWEPAAELTDRFPEAAVTVVPFGAIRLSLTVVMGQGGTL